MKTTSKSASGGNAGPAKSAAAAAPVSPGTVARSWRMRRSMTLEQLAQASGLSRGHLSRFERGEKSLSIASLMRLSRALGTSASALLGADGGDDMVHLLRVGHRAPTKVGVADGDYEFIPLTRTDGPAGPSAFIVKLDATSTIGNEVSHEGEEMFFVIAGAVKIELAARSILLRQGDFLQFPGLIKHRLCGVEPDTVILVVVTH